MPTPHDYNRAKDDRNEKDDTPSKTYSETGNYEMGSGLKGLIKYFSDMHKYGGSFQDDLDETIEELETVAETCDI